MIGAGDAENLLAFVEWCRAERQRLDGQRKVLTGARIATGENDGSGWVDMSFRDLLRVLDSIAELDILSDDHDGVPPDPTTSRRWFAALSAL